MYSITNNFFVHKINKRLKLNILSILKIFITKIKIIFNTDNSKKLKVYCAPNKPIRMISEGSCDNKKNQICYHIKKLHFRTY